MTCHSQEPMDRLEGETGKGLRVSLVGDALRCSLRAEAFG